MHANVLALQDFEKPIRASPILPYPPPPRQHAMLLSLVVSQRLIVASRKTSILT
jgi:hypothetical protein